MTTEIISTIAQSASSRRGLLGLMAKALAVTVPAAGGLAIGEAKALAEIATVPENPELLRLDPLRREAFVTLCSASNHFKSIIEAGNKSWPRAPEVLHAPHWHQRQEGDIDHDQFRYKTPWDEDAPIKIYSMSDLAGEKPRAPKKSKARTPHTIAKADERYAEELAYYKERMAEWTMQCKVANRYEAEKHRVRTVSGYYEARTAYHDAVKKLRAVCNEIAEHDATTLAGIAIKANALNDFMGTRYAYLADSDMSLWVYALAINVLRLDGRRTKNIEAVAALIRKGSKYRWEETDPAKYD